MQNWLHYLEKLIQIKNRREALVFYSILSWYERSSSQSQYWILLLDLGITAKHCHYIITEISVPILLLVKQTTPSESALHKQSSYQREWYVIFKETEQKPTLTLFCIISSELNFLQ